jgi:release factor glutamine methyltransferase
LKWAADDFGRRGIDTPRLDAEILLAQALSVKRVDLYLRFDQHPGDDALARFREAVKRRRDRESVAAIIGKKAFHDIELAVSEGVFIPRPETELLVDEALARLRALNRPCPRILDLGCGSGPIALAVAKAWPEARVLAVDLNPKAIALTAANAARLGLEDRVNVREGDLFAPAGEEAVFDLVLCNPPYVPSAEIPKLMPEVREHEPALALDGGVDGLDFIRRLMAEAPARLEPGGWLLMEVGEGQAQAAVAMAGDHLVHESTRKDLRGVPRIVIFKRQ